MYRYIWRVKPTVRLLGMHIDGHYIIRFVLYALLLIFICNVFDIKKKNVTTAVD